VGAAGLCPVSARHGSRRKECFERKLGVDTANQCMSFSLPFPVLLLSGDYNLLLLDQLLKFPELKLIGCCNELNAGYVLVLLVVWGVEWTLRCFPPLIGIFRATSSIIYQKCDLPKCSTPSLRFPSVLSPKLCRRWLRPQEGRVGHVCDLHGGWLERGQRCGRCLFRRFAFNFHQRGSQQQRPRLGPNLASYHR